jgi:4-coumarate--CoA ligase
MVGQVATLGLIPFFHIYGITGICCATLRNKGKVVVMGRTFLNALITQEVSFAPIVPPIGLVKNPIVEEFDLSKLKLQQLHLPQSCSLPLKTSSLASKSKRRV